MWKENSKRVLAYLKEKHGVENVTATDVAEALGYTVQSVNGVFTMAIQRRKLGERVPVEVEMPDGEVKTVKFLTLNEDGMNFDPSAEDEVE